MRTIEQLKAEIARLEKMAEQVKAREVKTTLQVKEWHDEKWISGTVGKSRLFIRASDFPAVAKAMAEFKLPTE
jgi:hypothetical protein